MLTPALTPEGILTCEGTPDSTADKKLAAAAAESEASLLILLGTSLLTAELDAGWRWLREWPRQFLTRLCQTQDALATPAPALSEREALIASAPPFAGEEYASAEVLERWWQAMAQYAARIAAEQPDGLTGWLRAENPLWHLVGRVTFHLAENKADSQRPFAFLATFTEKLSATGQLQHLPLARALQMYAGQKDQTALNALLAPVRTAAERSPLLREWLETRRLFQPQALAPQEAYRILRESPVFQDSGIVVKMPDWWRAGRAARPTVQVTIDAPKGASLNAGALLSFKLDAALNGDPLTPAEWEKLVSADTGLVSLRGQWVEVDGTRLEKVLEHWRRVQYAHGEGGVNFHDAMRLLARFEPKEAASEGGGLEDLQEWSAVIAGKGLAQTLEQMRDPALLHPPPDLLATLRPYQEKGFSWLHFMTRLGLGACLADDMGLGKTLQVISLLLKRKAEKKADAPALLIVPASLVGNWRGEAARFAPALRLFIAHPSVSTREQLTEAMAHPAEALRGYDAMLTTYQFLQRAESWLEHPWSLVILDEAQAIKSPGSATTKAVKRLRAPARIALTGTPVENRPGDLWSLFDFLNPGLLGGVTQFSAAVKNCAKRSDGYAPLRRLVQPYLLRRMKTDKNVISDLPDKVEVKAWCGLTKRQTTIYAKLIDQMAKMLNDKELEPIKRKGLVLGFLMKFKQVCNHPSHWNGDGAWGANDSGKFLRLAEICRELSERRERALIFTQFQETCEPIAHFLSEVFGRDGLVLHGGTPVKKRPQLVESFQQAGGPPFMVISVKAGGTGLNLTAASHVIHFDRWWNPAVENQATDRAFRIGQKKNVFVHKFVCQGTLEERIDALLEEKSALAKNLVGGASGAESILSEMSTEDLLHFVSLDLNAAQV